MADVQDIYNRLLARGPEAIGWILSLGDYKQQGTELVARCPACDAGRTKPGGHLYCSTTRAVFDCKKKEAADCPGSGDWLQYLERVRGLGFKEALAYLGTEAGVDVGFSDQERQQYRSYQQKADILEAAQDLMAAWLLREPDGQEALQYLLDRGYTEPEVERMRLGYYSQQRLVSALKDAGYKGHQIKESGLAGIGAAGEHYQLSLLLEDRAGRAVGICCRSILPADRLEQMEASKYRYSTGSKLSEALIGLAAARGTKQVLLVEGVLDALYLGSLGLPSVATGGTSLQTARIKALEDAGIEEAVLVPDAGAPGQKAAARWLQQLSTSSLRAYVAVLPDGFSDADEYVRQQGLDAFKVVLDDAWSRPRWLARMLVNQQDIKTDRGRDRAIASAAEEYSRLDGLEKKDFRESLQEAIGLDAGELEKQLAEAEGRASAAASREALQRTLRSLQEATAAGDITGAESELEEGLRRIRSSRGVVLPEPYTVERLLEDVATEPDGLLTGYQELDESIRLQPGALSIVAGRPKHGKTTLMLNLLLQMAERYPEQSFCFFSYEEAIRHVMRYLVMIEAGVVLEPSTNRQAYLGYLRDRRGTEPEIDAAVEKIRGLVADGRLRLIEGRRPVEDLAAVVRLLAGRYDIGAVFVDYLQKVPLRHQASSQPRYVDIKRVSEQLLDAAIDSSVAVVLGAQIGRGDKSQKGRDRIRLDNLRESGDIEQDAALVLGLFNEAKDTEQEADEAEIGGRSYQVPDGPVQLEVQVLANRHGRSGQVACLDFEQASMRIKDRQTIPSSLV